MILTITGVTIIKTGYLIECTRLVFFIFEIPSSGELIFKRLEFRTSQKSFGLELVNHCS